MATDGMCELIPEAAIGKGQRRQQAIPGFWFITEKLADTDKLSRWQGSECPAPRDHPTPGRSRETDPRWPAPGQAQSSGMPSGQMRERLAQRFGGGWTAGHAHIHGTYLTQR